MEKDDKNPQNLQTGPVTLIFADNCEIVHCNKDAWYIQVYTYVKIPIFDTTDDMWYSSGNIKNDCKHGY